MKVDRSLPLLARVCLIALAYFLTARIGLLFVAEPESVAAFWPASGLLLAALVLHDQGARPVILLAVFFANLAANLTVGNPPAVSLGFAVANCVESVIGAWLLVRFAGMPITFGSLREVGGLVVVAPLGCAIGAVLGGVVAVVGGGAASFWSAWKVWWVADLLGMLLVTPVILTWAVPWVPPFRTRRLLLIAEGTGLLAGTLAISGLVLGNMVGTHSLLYATLPLPLWTALRFGPRGASTASLVLAVAAVWNTARGFGPFVAAGEPVAAQVLSVQMFLSVVILSALVLAASITERQWGAETLGALYRASLQSREPLTLQERLDRLLRTAREVLDLDRLNILLADPDGRWLRAVASLGTEGPLGALQVPIGPAGGGIAQAYLTHRAIFWDARGPVPEHLRLKPPYDRIEGFRSQVFANVPLILQGRTIGVLGADRKHSRRPLEPAMRELLQLFAAEAALTIEHARLYDELRLSAIQLGAKVEERTRQLQEAVQRAEELSRHKSEFLANMSHELRTPLSSVIGFAEVLVTRTVGPLNEKQVRFLTHILTAGRHLLGLIDEILDLAKVEAGKVVLKPEPLRVAATLEETLVLARGLAHEKHQTLQAEIAPDLPVLRADPVRFKQICFNLLSNAVKFTPEGGTITVTARTVARESARPALQPSEVPPDLPPAQSPELGLAEEWLEVRVTDMGIGIKPEDLPRLFQEFVQLEAQPTRGRGGTGLGLVLTRRLVELHGGRIWVESEGEEKGSTFTVALPFAGPEGRVNNSQ
jgi:signal transduction histidine kinase/integral membrane sensor domain MASE1